MKPRFHSRFPLATCAFALTLAGAAVAHAAELTWNAALPGDWSTSNTNWSGSSWSNSNPDNAIFNNLQGTVTLTEAITGGSLSFKDGGRESNAHELILTNSNLTLQSISVSGVALGGNVDSITDAYNQRQRLENMTATVSGSVTVQRGMLYLNGATMNVSGTIKSVDAWCVFRADNSTVTATGGIDFSGIATQVELYGGTATTPSIKVGNATWNGSGGLTMGGGVTLVATGDSSDYIQVFNDGNSGSRGAATLSSGGMALNTAYAVTIATQINGGGSLTKAGAGTLTLTQSNNYTGGTTVNQGVLVLASGAWTLSNVGGGGVTVGSGATLHADNCVANQLNGLTLNGGTVDAVGGGNSDWGNFFLTGNVTATGTSNLNAETALRATNVDFSVASGATLNVGGVLHNGAYYGSPGTGGTPSTVSKSGDGTLVLSGMNTYTGGTTVSAGTLSLTHPVLDDGSAVTIANGANFNLNFAGNDIIGSLDIDGSGPLPPGTYNASHPTYGSYFTGTGSLVVLGANGSWISTVDGNWSDTANWNAGIVAAGYDQTATFNAATGVTVTLNTNRIIGNLAFDTSDYTLAGANTLTLDDASTTPTISVGTGRTATISANVAGFLGLEKTGSGKLVFTGIKSYTGGTTVTGGTLELAGATGGNAQIHGSLTVSPGATVAVTGGDGTGFGFYNNPVSSITVDGGTITASGTTHLGFGTHAAMSLNNGAALFGQWEWNGDSSLSFSSSGDSTNTISGQLVLRPDAGSSHTFYVDDGSAATDLQVSANLVQQYGRSGLVKTGTGTMVLAGSNSYDGNTVVNDGQLQVTAASGLQFSPTTNGVTNAVSGSSTTATLSFLGTVSLDLSAANTTLGNSWTLFNLASFTTAPVLTPAAVTSTTLGSFTQVTPGVWELPVTGAKWVFTKATGTLTYATAAADYETWMALYPSITAPADKLPGADPDHDGIPNLLEYVLQNGDPSLGSTAILPTTTTTATDLVFTFHRRAASTANTTQRFEYSDDLTIWTPLAIPGGTGVVVTDIGGGIDEVVVTVPRGSNTNLFGRLAVTKP